MGEMQTNQKLSEIQFLQISIASLSGGCEMHQSPGRRSQIYLEIMGGSIPLPVMNLAMIEGQTFSRPTRPYSVF